MGKYYLNFSKMNIALGALATAGLAGTGYMAYKNHQLKDDLKYRDQTIQFRDNEIGRLNEHANVLKNQLAERTANNDKYRQKLKEEGDMNLELEDKLAKLSREHRDLTEAFNKQSTQLNEYKNSSAQAYAELEALKGRNR